MNTIEKRYLDAKASYYLGEPIMTDAEFDALESVLRQDGSEVVNKIGYDVSVDAGLKIPHRIPMKSLRKINTRQDGVEPFDQIEEFVSSISVGHIYAEPKYDGNAVKLIYEDGKLVRGMSRGDGVFGIDITDKVRLFVPNTIDYTDYIEIIGEVVISKQTFNERYASKYKNPRNFVSGKLGKDYSLLNESEYQKEWAMIRDFEFIAFDYHTTNNEYPIFIDLGVQVAMSYPLSDIKETYHRFKKLQSESKYLLDGFVLKVNKLHRQYIGETDHHPKWAVAVKFETEEAITQIESITWTIGTNGNMTPVANLTPVELNGTMVSKASLYNYRYVVDNKAYPTAMVSLIKSGEIIPRVVNIIVPAENVQEYENDPYLIITKYSFAEVSDVELTDKHAVFKGDSKYADTRKLHKGIVALGIQNVGPSLTERLYKSGITTIEKLFDEDEFNSFNLVFLGEFKAGKELENLIESIDSIASVQLSSVIEALQFNGCGTTMSKQIANYLAEITYDFKGLEKAVITNVLSEESTYRIVEFVELLKSKGIKVIYPTEATSDDIKTFEMTGTPPDSQKFILKSDYANFARNYGWLHSSLNQKTDVLVTDSYDSNSTKMKKARKNGTKILTYEDFLKIFE